MAVKLAFAAGLFCVVFFMFGSSQDIPDGVVYTEVKKTLVNGTTGILKCRFKGLPNAVYWKKGSDPAKSPSIIIWSYGEKSGPRYEDGSCDIDGNYSLVIRNVRNTDAGRYICRVSNYKGILKYNYTDVMITNSAVRTEQSVAVQKGKVGVVPCQVNIRPRRISWVRGANDTLVSMDLSRSVVERSGPGYEEGLFNITKEYSLLINEVKILHEDSYFCEVTDFDTGNLFRDVTGLNVFALPLEPYPSIEECPKEQQDLSSCTIRIASETALTCEVREYYPVIDLFFMHGSLRVDSLETRVWNNSDGTRNKRITIATNDTSETVFECVAKGLVGEAESRSMTIHLLQNVQHTRVVVAVVVPAILVSTIIVIAVCFIQRRKRHLTRKYAKVPMVYKVKQRELISYIELWKLVKYAREENLSDKLGKVLDKLTKDEYTSKALPTDEDYYQGFCQWKVGYVETYQKVALFNACRNAGLKSSINKLQKYSDATRAMTPDDMEHTLWHIAGSDRIQELLTALGVLPDALSGLNDKGEREIVKEAMNILTHLRKDTTTPNQELMLSRALEKIEYSPDDSDFFQIPGCQKCGLDKNEIQAFLFPQITSRHCTDLIDAMLNFGKEYHWNRKLFGSKNKDVWIDNIIEQNQTALFDSHQMLEVWWAEQNCSNYGKRCRLRNAAKVLSERTDDLDMPKVDEPVGNHTDSPPEKSEETENQEMPKAGEPTRDHTDVHCEMSKVTANQEESDERWPTKKMLEQIGKLVPQTRMIQLWEALHISYIPDDLIDEEKRLQTMCRWRDNITKPKKEDNVKVLSKALKSIGFDGLLSPPKSKFIYKAELVDMALDLIMEDFRPFADSLGIKRTKFTSYRQEFRDAHLDQGTIRLVLELFKKIDSVEIGHMRPDVCSVLYKAGYPNVSKRFAYASEPSYGELFAIETATTQEVAANVDGDYNETTGKMKQQQKGKNKADGEKGRSPSIDGEKAEEFPTSLQKTPRSYSTLTSPNVEETKNNDDDVEDTEDSGVAPKSVSDIENRSKHAKSNTRGYRQRVSDLQRILELTDDDIPDSSTASLLTPLKIWKERMCPSLLDHRVVLAEGLQKINKPHLVAGVISGKFHSRETSLEFIKEMVNEMDEGRRITLRSLLEIKEEKQGKVMSSDEMSRRICDWVANWTKAMESSVKNYIKDALRVKETPERHRDFNDKLVDNGFLDLAREIMTIEQEL